jgi:hypothetical protein
MLCSPRLVSHHGLLRRRIPISLGLQLIHNLPERLLLLIRQRDLPRGKVLLKALGLCRAGDGNHALGGDPGERNLRQGAALLCGELLDLFDDGLVLEEILALELGNWRKE